MSAAVAPVGNGWPASRRPARVVLSGGPFHGLEHPAPEDRWVSLYMPDEADPTVTHCYRPHSDNFAVWTYAGAARTSETPGTGWVPSPEAIAA